MNAAPFRFEIPLVEGLSPEELSACRDLFAEGMKERDSRSAFIHTVRNNIIQPDVNFTVEGEDSVLCCRGKVHQYAHVEDDLLDIAYRIIELLNFRFVVDQDRPLVLGIGRSQREFPPVPSVERLDT